MKNREVYVKKFVVIMEQLGTCGMATIVEKREVIGKFETEEEAEFFKKNYNYPNAYARAYIMPTFEKVD